MDPIDVFLAAILLIGFVGLAIMCQRIEIACHEGYAKGYDDGFRAGYKRYLDDNADRDNKDMRYA